MTWHIGAHTIDNGGIQMAVLRAGNAGMTALQLFTAIPRFYGDKSTIKPERVARFKAALAKTKIKPANVVVHAAYVLSVATPEDEKWARASAGLTKELERSRSGRRVLSPRLSWSERSFRLGEANREGDRRGVADD